jgi:large subunit ribosomal protein L24
MHKNSIVNKRRRITPTCFHNKKLYKKFFTHRAKTMPSLHPRTLFNNLIPKWKIVKGDLVQIMTGQEAGKQGVVKKILRKKNRLIVEGCNLVKRHIKKRQDSPGTVITKEASIHYSNVLLVSPTTNEPTKVEMRFLEDGSKVRFAKKGQVVIPKPAYKRGRKPANALKDTAPASVTEKTYTEQEIIELKNRYLRSMELMHYNQLKQQYENQQKKEVKKTLDQRRFQFEVYRKAKEMFQQQQS